MPSRRQAAEKQSSVSVQVSRPRRRERWRARGRGSPNERQDHAKTEIKDIGHKLITKRRGDPEREGMHRSPCACMHTCAVCLIQGSSQRAVRRCLGARRTIQNCIMSRIQGSSLSSSSNSYFSVKVAIRSHMRSAPRHAASWTNQNAQTRTWDGGHAQTHTNGMAVKRSHSHHTRSAHRHAVSWTNRNHAKAMRKMDCFS